MSTSEEEKRRAHELFVDLLKQQGELKAALEEADEGFQAIRKVRLQLLKQVGFNSEEEFELSKANRHKQKLIWADIDWGYKDQFTVRALWKKVLGLALWGVWIAVGVMLYRNQGYGTSEAFQLLWIVSWCGLAGWARTHIRRRPQPQE